MNKGRILHTRRTFDAGGWIWCGPKGIEWACGFNIGSADDIGKAEEDIEDVADIQKVFCERQLDDVWMQPDVQKVLSKKPQLRTCTQIEYDNYLSKQADCMRKARGKPCEFSSSPVGASPRERKITDGDAPLYLCKFGPGGDYVTEYTPKTSRSLWTAPAWMTRMLSRAWAALRSRL